MGSPTKEDLHLVKSNTILSFLNKVPQMPPQPLKLRFPNGNDEALDFLSNLLVFDPTRRFTVEQALEHPYMSRYHDPKDEPVCRPIPMDFFAFDYCEKPPSKEDLRGTQINY